MNLSKTEKLLAAKKKLKEFQLNKQLHENALKHQNHSTELQEQQHQHAENKKPEVSHEHVPAPVEANENYASDSNHESQTSAPSAIHSENNINVESASPPVQNNIEVPSNSELEHKIETPSNHEENQQFMGQPSFPTQKEHLLEMASQVADVLTNNTDITEPLMETELAYRDQYVNSYLEEQKKVVNDLNLDITNYRSRILELERQLATRDADFQAQLIREVGPLREQLQAHAQTTGILIGEKAELTAVLAQTQQSLKQSTEETEELSGKLRTAQARISELEKEVTSLKHNNEEVRKNSLQLRIDNESLDLKCNELRKEKEELALEGSELKQKLNLKKTELVSTQQELQETTALLSLSELRIQQMKDAAPNDDEGQNLLALQQELNSTKAMITALNEEKEAASKQYQNYIRQLDTRQSKLLSEVQSQTKTIEDLETREQSYVQRLSELEQQLQQERQKTEVLVPVQDRKQEVENLVKNFDELTLEHERLHITLAEKDSQIETLTKEIQELREITNQNVEVSKLATALESEQLGASRAVSQNQQLKQQLTEMENAFVSLSNAKLDLTEQLQAERSVGKKLNAMLNKVEFETEELKEKLQERESALAELEKERLQNAQIADQMQHYQAQCQHANTYQTELQNALVYIERLEREKQELLQKLDENKEKEVMVQNNLPRENTENETKEDLENEVTPVVADEYNSLCNSVTEPVQKLEERFKETMERVAELTEEKQRLEHLVLQLQSETETIGEYIALYQKQRSVLQSRARERETQFRQILEQRNQQQEQLHKVKVLVSDFLTKQFISPTDHVNAVNADSNEINENNVATTKVAEPVDVSGEALIQKPKKAGEAGISDLLDLLTEIKDCKDSCALEPNFHPCPWCSGKLITV